MGEDVPLSYWYRDYSKPNEIDPTPVSRADQDQPHEGSPASHKPEIYDIEDFPADIRGHCFDDQTVKPYAIEEPDEEPSSEPKKPSPPQQGQPRYWEDLVGSMEELHCDSDNGNSGLAFSKRGRKRKPTNPPSFARTGQRCQSTPVPDAQYETSMGPKRPRKKDELRMGTERNLKTARRHHVQRSRVLSGSSSTSVSTDTSSTDFTNGSPAPDAMDLD